MKTGAVIPAYQVEQCLGPVLEGVLRHLPREDVLVLDDGSTDGTAEVARRAGVRCFSHLANQGKGAALRRGYEILRRTGAEAIFSLDADGQHDPGHIPEFLRALDSRGLDLVIGDRMNDLRRMPLDRQFSNTVSSRMLSRLIGQRLRDSQCGFRLLRAGLLEGLEFRRSRYDFESELIISAARAGARIGSVPVSVCYNGRSSHIRRFRDTWNFAGLWLAEWRAGRRG